MLLEFFELPLPFVRMEPANQVTTPTNDFVLGYENSVFVVYLPQGGSGTTIDLGSRTVRDLETPLVRPHATAVHC